MTATAAFRTMTSRASYEWRTPKHLYAELDAEFHFNFDPCPLGGDTDGRSTLFQPWQGKRVFCNPPYGPQVPAFLVRWRETELAVYLLKAATDTAWFHDIVLPFATEIRFIRGRVRYNDGPHPAPFPSLIAVFRP